MNANDVINHCEVRSHFYADDMQLYASCSPATIDNVRLQLSTCAADVAKWCESRRLHMNSDKTEVIWFGSHANLARSSAHNCSLHIGLKIIIPATRLLGVLLDTELTIKPHIARTAVTCFYHLRLILQIRRRFGADLRSDSCSLWSYRDWTILTLLWPVHRDRLLTPCSGSNTGPDPTQASYWCH